VHSDIDLAVLEALFTYDEIVAVVKNFPNNKSPGLMGLMLFFLGSAGQSSRKTSMIQFHQGILQNINSCFVSLVPKQDNAKTAYFRPISLLNCILLSCV
jgi:hypothetical protein